MKRKGKHWHFHIYSLFSSFIYVFCLLSGGWDWLESQLERSYSFFRLSSFHGHRQMLANHGQNKIK